MDQRFHNAMVGKRSMLIITTLVAGAVGLNFYELTQLKQEVQFLRHQGQGSVVQYQTPATDTRIYVGSADSLLNEFTCEPQSVENGMAVYLAKAKVRAFSEGDRVFFLRTLNGESTLIEAGTANGVIFTASIEVPIESVWSLDFVKEGAGTRRSEVLQEFQSYTGMMTERWPIPFISGSAEFGGNSDVYKTENKISLIFSGDTIEDSGMAEVVAQVQVNGQLFVGKPMTSRVYSGDSSGIAQQELEASFGVQEIPVKTGDVVETVVRVRAKSGEWYTCTVEKLKRSAQGMEPLDVGSYQWQAE